MSFPTKPEDFDRLWATLSVTAEEKRQPHDSTFRYEPSASSQSSLHPAPPIHVLPALYQPSTAQTHQLPHDPHEKTQSSEDWVHSEGLTYPNAAPHEESPFPMLLPQLSLDLSELDEESTLIITEIPSTLPKLPQPTTPDLQFLEVLGEGGMGRVYLARQRSLHREVAVKLLKPGHDDQNAARSILREALVTGYIEHPNTIPIHLLGTDDTGKPLLVMKRIEGTSWKLLLRKFGSAEELYWKSWSSDPLTRHLEILIDICNIVHYAHRKGIVHRDIKPENVMIGEFGEVYLVDWGLAVCIVQQPQPPSSPLYILQQLLPPQRRKVIGTPNYMAPEMLHGDTYITERTDVFLLGSTLFEILTGSPPHLGTSLYDVLHAVAHPKEFHFSEGIPEELAAICKRAMQYHPEQRYPDVSAFRNAIANFLQHRSSMEQTKDALLRLVKLTHILEHQATEISTAEEEQIHALFAECRYGYRQALKEWEHNQDAQEGLQECLSLMVRHEIESRQLKQARMLLTELPKPDPLLTAQVEQLEAQLKKEQTEQQKLHRIRQEYDFSIAARHRFFLVLWIGSLASVLSFANALLIGSNGREPTPTRLLFTVSIFTTSLLIAAFFSRKHIFQNAVNRQFMGSIVVLCVGLLGHRLLGFVQKTSTGSLHIVDLFLMGSIFATNAIQIDRAFMWMAVPSFVCGMLSIWLPLWAPWLMTLAITVGWVTYAIAWQKRALTLDAEQVEKTEGTSSI